MTVRLEMTPESRALVGRSFERLGAASTGHVLLAAVVAGALPIQNEAKVNAPAVTGTLRRSIHIGGFSHLSPGFNPAEGYSDIGGVEVTASFVRVWVGTNLVYARRIEYGFVGEDSLGRHYNQAAQPYLRPAFDTQAEAADRDMNVAIRQLLRDV